MLRKLLIITLLFSTVAVTYGQKKDKKKKNRKGKTEQVTTDPEKIDYKAEGAPLPHLDMTTRKGEKLTEKDFDNGANLLVMLFNPTCDHCQEMTVQLEKNIDLFQKSKILLIAAPSMMDYLEFYNNVTRYSKYPQITVAVDSAGYIDKVFTYTALPQINFYDKKRKLLKTFSGDTPIEALKPYIE
ncbi:MAG: hypothetical protein H6550_08130 [Chitinophagales bacterium]|nr:hypothetical protein [Chitinophagales bacterium]